MYGISLARILNDETLPKHRKREFLTKLNKAIEELEQIFPQQK